MFLFSGSAKQSWRERREEQGRGPTKGGRTAIEPLAGGDAAAAPRRARALAAAEGLIAIGRSMEVTLSRMRRAKKPFYLSESAAETRKGIVILLRFLESESKGSRAARERGRGKKKKEHFFFFFFFSLLKPFPEKNACLRAALSLSLFPPLPLRALSPNHGALDGRRAQQRRHVREKGQQQQPSPQRCICRSCSGRSRCRASAAAAAVVAPLCGCSGSW